MPRGHVNEYTRTLADGTEVKVADHDREYEGAAPKEMKKTRVQAHRQARQKEASKARRKKRRQKGLFQARRAGRRLKKAYKAARRRKRAMAAGLLLAGLLEVAGWFTFQLAGAIITAVVLVLSMLAAGLLSAGGSDRP